MVIMIPWFIFLHKSKNTEKPEFSGFDSDSEQRFKFLEDFIIRDD